MNIITFQIAKSLGGYNPRCISEVREFQNCYLVIFVKGLGLRPRFVSKKDILKPVVMSEAIKMLTPKSTTAKLIQLPINEIKETLLLQGNVVAVATYFTWYLIPLKYYKEYFVESRKARINQVVIDFSDGTTAINKDNGHVYKLIQESDGIYCQCQDYANQRKAFSKGCCKHGYALLNELGFNSLAEYVENQVKQASELEDYYLQRQGIC